MGKWQSRSCRWSGAGPSSLGTHGGSSPPFPIPPSRSVPQPLFPSSTTDPDGGFVLNVEDASYDGSTPVSKTGSGGSIPPASVRRTNRCSPQKAPPASLRRISGRSKAALKDPASGRFPFPSQGWNGEIQGSAPGRRLRMPVHSSRKFEKGVDPGTSGLPRNSSTVLHVRP